MGLNSVLDGGE